MARRLRLDSGLGGVFLNHAACIAGSGSDVNFAATAECPNKKTPPEGGVKVGTRVGAPHAGGPRVPAVFDCREWISWPFRP
ncbi:hypothetical protein SAMN04489759_11031 [Sulfitobacter delicatus]|uniref:Uncharacterized protein n=1 Tax=Sulfitobacter delicatus TaxID=218672 RepID=A0A1G7W1Q0_9RHOB|nr:hypothetical protein SAMN04489759_11031 [Sulfitobacter delicatus]